MKERQLTYDWRRTWPDRKDDYVCEVGGESIGRVRYHTTGPIKFWRWFMGVDDLALQIMPATGHHDDKIEACRQLESAYGRARWLGPFSDDGFGGHSDSRVKIGVDSQHKMS
jgi:hypothetical protein